jgi:hypothetical protein
MHTGSEGATPLGKLPGMEEDLTVNTGEIGVSSTLNIAGDFTNTNEVIAGTMVVGGALTNASTIFTSAMNAVSKRPTFLTSIASR